MTPKFKPVKRIDGHEYHIYYPLIISALSLAWISSCSRRLGLS